MIGDFYIWSVEHTAWWSPGRWGYTPRIAEAGLYTDAESAEIVRLANRVAFHECRIPWECAEWLERAPEGLQPPG